MATLATLVILESTVRQTNGSVISLSCSSWRLNDVNYKVKTENNSFFTKTYRLLPNRKYVVPYLMDLFDREKSAGFYPYKWKLGDVLYDIETNTIEISWFDNISGGLIYPDSGIISTLAEPIFAPTLSAEENSGGATDPRVVS